MERHRCLYCLTGREIVFPHLSTDHNGIAAGLSGSLLTVSKRDDFGLETLQEISVCYCPMCGRELMWGVPYGERMGGHNYGSST